MTQQGCRQASFRAIGNSAGPLNADMLAAFSADAAVPAGTPFNGAMMLWLQERLGSSSQSISGLASAFAADDSARCWSDLGYLPVFSDLWPGSNGAAWSSLRWNAAETGSSSTATIQSNAGQTNPDGAGYTFAKVMSKSPVLADFDLTFEITFETDGEQTHCISFRGDGGWSGSNAEFQQNGYTLFMFSTGGGVRLYKTNSSTATILAATVAKTWGTSVWYGRIRAQGTSIKARVWQGSEPASWDIEETDSDHASGIFAISSVNGFATTARPGSWDNLKARILP